MENYFNMNLEKQDIDAISNLGLAHMGDCVYEILCRAYLCTRGDKTVDKLHRDTIHMVKATAQAKFAAVRWSQGWRTVHRHRNREWC